MASKDDNEIIAMASKDDFEVPFEVRQEIDRYINDLVEALKLKEEHDDSDISFAVDAVTDSFLCGVNAVSCWSLWVLIGITVAVKRYWGLRRLQTHVQKSFVQRQRLRKRRLRDALNDPVLLLHFEDRLRKAHNGNEQRVLESIESLRVSAETPVSDQDDAKDYRQDAAKLLMKGSLAVYLICIVAINLFDSRIMPYMESLPYDSQYSDREDQAYYGLYGLHYLPSGDCALYQDMIRYHFFFLIHILDGYFIYRKAHTRNKFASRKPPRENDVKEPLLSSFKEGVDFEEEA